MHTQFPREGGRDGAARTHSFRAKGAAGAATPGAGAAASSAGPDAETVARLGERTRSITLLKVKEIKGESKR